MPINIQPGDVLNNNDISTFFLCSSQGGMRRSIRTNSLVIVSDHTKSLYEDRWEGDVFHYTGMGMNGDQDINFMQNRTLAESGHNGVEIHLFEVFEPTRYIYIGQVKNVASPYQEDQLGESRTPRKVWIFPLVALGPRPIIPSEVIERKALERDKIARKMSDDELAERAAHSSRRPSRRESTGTVFERNPFVTENAKRWSNGICQLCDQPAPFQNKKGEPHLHTHHIDWLYRGGDDSIENTVAVCPNCHDKLHILNRPGDVAFLKQKVRRYLLNN
ncbi:HNH endonuclease [Cohnella suwonensis]|uniref:HNH endonuclease n=1 Tax=Cohnella suwonensis TaxID=696072 RepID=A0ABW0LTY8_9BACL